MDDIEVEMTNDERIAHTLAIKVSEVLEGNSIVLVMEALHQCIGASLHGLAQANPEAAQELAHHNVEVAMIILAMHSPDQDAVVH